MSGDFRGAIHGGSPNHHRGGGRGRGLRNSAETLDYTIQNNYYQQAYPASYGVVSVSPPGTTGYGYGYNRSPLAGPSSHNLSNAPSAQQYVGPAEWHQNDSDSFVPQTDIPFQQNQRPRTAPSFQNDSVIVQGGTPSQNMPLKPALKPLQKHDSSGSDEALDERAYISSIIDAYLSTEECSQVICQSSLPYAKVTLISKDDSADDLNFHRNQAPCDIIWKFQVYVTHPSVLKYVSLICQEPSKRNRFRMIDARGTPLDGCKVASGDCFKKHAGIYEVWVEFHCSHTGIYKQWLTFDITGQAPYIVRQLHVFVGDENDPAFAVEKFRFDTTVAELDWNSSTVDIAMSDWPAYDREPVARQLLAKWKPLGAALDNDSLALRTKSYGPDNYKRVMHGLIRLEEAAVAGAIGRVFIDAPRMTVEKSPSGFGLDGFITLGQALDTRTKVGALTLKNASRMLLAFKDFVDENEGDEDRLHRVYEADIIEKRRGASKHSKQQSPNSGELFNTIVRLHLSQRCIDEQKLEAGTPVFLHQARFQISRLPFVEWHDAVEKVFCWNVLFPTVELQQVPMLNMDRVQLDHRIVDQGLLHNPGQMAVVKSILARPVGDGINFPTLPPIIIQGAFGTGKTFTLAQALKILLDNACRNNPQIRIVLCTISNSAADLYITRYLYPFLSRLQQSGWTKNQLPRIMRIYKSQRDPSTIDKDVLKFCRLQPSLLRPNQYEFASATTGDVNSAQLIISNIVGLMDLQRLCLPKNTFSHIFLDEAAQSFEADALKALCLAGPQTRVVMAGDPRQMAGGTIHCQLLKRYGFDRALIERVAKYYGSDFDKFVSLGYGHVLQTNYRCHPRLMDFIKKHFYPDLTNMKNEYICKFTDYFPFRFYNTDTNAGVELFHQPSSTYYNFVEAVEVQYRVNEILKNWPDEFTEKDAAGKPIPPQSEIAVIAASDAQVMLLQQKLRESPDTHNVAVSHISWLQGLEFRAIFISTVRTLQISADDESEEDLTFLSDQRLLNTAITRAKSVVVIVGSEKTLTNVGRCSDVWKSLIDSCRVNNTYFPAKPMASEGMPEQANREAARNLLRSRFENVTVVPDYEQQRVMMKSAAHFESNGAAPNRQSRGQPVTQPENDDIARRFPKFAQICEKLLTNGSLSNVPIPWSGTTSSRMIWIKVLAATEFFGNVRHSTSLMNRDEAEVAADLIRHLIARSTGEILVVCATAAQATWIKKRLVSSPQQRFTVIDVSHPLPRQTFNHLVMSLVKTNIKSERALIQERGSADRVGRAKVCLNNDLVDMDLIAKVIEMGSAGGVAFVGNHLNASVAPAWDWLYRRIQHQGGSFNSIQELRI